jgi:hypothetical protein
MPPGKSELSNSILGVRLIGATTAAAAAFGCAAGLAMAGPPHAGYALRPDRGIGPVSLGEAKSRVEHAAGRGTAPCGYTCLRTYASSRGNLSVRYDDGKVADVESSAGKITLGGVPIRHGPKALRKQLRGWRHFRCQGLRIYEHAGESSPTPGTSIYFGPGKRVDIQVSSQGQGGCGAQ